MIEIVEKKEYSELLALKGKIREENTTYIRVAKKIGMDPSTFSNKINGHTAFTSDEVHAVVEELDIEEDNIIRYFFPICCKMQKRIRGYIKMDSTKILKEEIQKTRKELPFSLKVDDLAELMNTSTKTVYLRLERGEIPGSNKLMGRWRVPRDVFLSWWYGSEIIKIDVDNNLK